MKYLKISNAGKMPKQLLHLIGASTKKGNTKKIGEFGTGLKYAIAYLLRNKNNFRFFSGKEEFVFTAQKQSVMGIEFEEIFVDGKTTSITTAYGEQWEAWQIVREIWCNAKDEGKERKKICEEDAVISGDAGRTTIYIELTPDIQKVVDSWDLYFNKQKPLFENAQFAVYPNENRKGTYIYKNGVLVKEEAEKDALFRYDFKDAKLNELRQYMGSVKDVVLQCLLNSNKEVIKLYLEALKAGFKVLEQDLPYAHIWLYGYSRDTVKDLFSGYVFLKYRDGQKKSSQIISVSDDMFKFLEECGCSCEVLKTYHSTAYSLSNKGAGIQTSGNFEVKPIQGTDLHERISKIARKFDLNIDFQIVAHVGNNEAEVFVHKGVLNFNASLQDQSPQELEATVLTANLFSTDENSFKSIKRMIKFLKDNKQFLSIYHGKRL